jgi:serine protease Do
VADQLRTSGKVVRGRIGVQIDQVTKDVAESIGLGKPYGALVRSVEAAGPAEKAGVEPGDIITKFDGKTVDKAGDLPRMVGASRPGQKTTLQVFRRGNFRDLTVSLIEFDSDVPKKAVDRDGKPAPSTAVSNLGLVVSDLTESQRRELSVKNGVRVDKVEGAATRAGVHEGDVLLSIDNTEITSVSQLESVVGKIDKAKSVSVLIRRGAWVTFVVIRPAK